MADSLTYSARWVVPVTRPPLENGTVTIRGDRIEAVDPQGVRSADRDLGNVAILPGLVNAHTHLDLSGARGLIPPTRPENFPDWLRSVIAYRRSRSADQVQQDIRRGLADCLAAGTVLLGDITAGGASWYVLKDAPIHSVIGWELIGLRESRYLEVTDEFQRRALPSWIDEDRPIEMPGNPRCRWWAAPHAPYSANHDQARGQLFLGNAVMHLAESPGEMALLTAKRGPFVRFLEELGLWNPAEIKSTADEFLLAWADSKLPRLYVHGNYLPGET
jgi:cytosine/adenosine deaminase-related metal-dependent hydrolase